MARPVERPREGSVSPLRELKPLGAGDSAGEGRGVDGGVKVEGEVEEDIGGKVEVEGEGLVDCEERIKLEEPGDVVKMLKDPSIPTQEEVDKHYAMGHIPFRCWRPYLHPVSGETKAS